MKKLISGLFLTVYLSIIYAEPPKEVIAACKEQTSVHPNVLLSELMVDHDDRQQGVGSCLDEPNRKIMGVKVNDRTFYQEHCGSKKYLLTGNRKFAMDKSVKNSSSLMFEPYGVSNNSNWYHIQYNNKDYICMTSSFGEKGWASAVSQYYVVENGFDENQALNVYFYFFDK